MAWLRKFVVLALAVAALAVGCDSGSDSAGPVCDGGVVTCSADGTELRVCVDGQWQITHCMRDQQKLCEVDRCVDPWRYGAPEWSRCEDEPRATAETLADKADYYETLARRLHVHPELGWMMGAILPDGMAEADASYDDVVSFKTGENDGLWSALYLTAEAYRYAATGDEEALDMIRLLLEGQRKRMAITGVPGLYTRQLIPPDVSGVTCPSALSDYVPDEEKDDNRWVRIGSDGCVQVVDPNSMQFVSTDHCGIDEFAGWCWLDNVSEDEYSGHMLAHAAVARLVDAPDVQEANAALLLQIGRHLMDNDLELYDWDGRRTEHGKLWPPELLSGYMAAMSLAFVKTTVVGTGDDELAAFLGCLLSNKAGDAQCIDGYGAAETPYDDLVHSASLYLGCSSNWNNFSMHMLSLHTLLMLEQDPVRRAKYQAALTDDMFAPLGVDRPLGEQNNAFFDFIFAADKALGPASEGPAYQAVENAICMLRQFPASQHQRDISCPPESCVPVCDNRFGDPMTDYARPMAERCMATFVWWRSPYDVDGCSEDLTDIHPPADYLLPYWMGRYYGFIGATM